MRFCRLKYDLSQKRQVFKIFKALLMSQDVKIIQLLDIANHLI